MYVSAQNTQRAMWWVSIPAPEPLIERGQPVHTAPRGSHTKYCALCRLAYSVLRSGGGESPQRLEIAGAWILTQRVFFDS